MLVRCGRCRVELEVAGAGEFACPNCGARNTVRAPGVPAADPFGLPDLGSVEGGFGAPPPPPSPPAEESGVRWIRCPSCAYRFAVGEVEQVGCPACGTTLDLAGDEVTAATGEPSSGRDIPSRGEV